MIVGTIHLFTNVFAALSPSMSQMCVLRFGIQKVSYTAGMFSVYGFLWLRQKLFYSNPSLRYLYSKKLRYSSWTVLFVILLCFACQCTLSVLGVTQDHGGSFSANHTSCINVPNRLWTVQVSLSALTSFLVHISLMGLFLFPLCKHSLENASFFVRTGTGSFVSRSSIHQRSTGVPVGEESTTASPSADSRRHFHPTNNNKIRRSLDVKRPSIIRTPQADRHRQKVVAASDRLRTLIIRCLTLTAICVMATITVTLLTVKFYHGGLLATFLYGSNMLINMVCCTGCFSDWPSTLLPFCVRPKKRKVEHVKKQSPSEVSQRLIARQFDSVV